MRKTGVLLVGHGSRLPYNKELVESTGKIIAERHPEYIVKCAFTEINDPDIGKGMTAFRSEEIDSLVIVPMFLARGVHTMLDIPFLIDLPEGSTTGTFLLNEKSIPMTYTEPFGSPDLLAALMAYNLKHACEPV